MKSLPALLVGAVEGLVGVGAPGALGAFGFARCIASVVVMTRSTTKKVIRRKAVVEGMLNIARSSTS